MSQHFHIYSAKQSENSKKKIWLNINCFYFVFSLWCWESLKDLRRTVVEFKSRLLKVEKKKERLWSWEDEQQSTLSAKFSPAASLCSEETDECSSAAGRVLLALAVDGFFGCFNSCVEEVWSRSEGVAVGGGVCAVRPRNIGLSLLSAAEVKRTE